MVLICVVGANAVKIAIDCNGKTANPGVDATAICSEATPQVTISYYITNVQAGDHLDQMAVRLDYNNTLLGYSSAGLNTGIGRAEFMQSAGGTAVANGIAVDSNTIDTGVGIQGDCAASGTCPVGLGNVLKITFDCLDYGTVYCSGASPSFALVDTRDIATTKTWWANDTGARRLFESGCTSDDECNSLDTECADGVCSAGTCVQQFKSAATVCRAASGGCDVAEKCTGSNANCPADAKSTAVCRNASGVCDLSESCDGVNNNCPSDAVRPNTYECRASAGTCDLAENCDGSTKNCPTDVFRPNTYECRASAGVCDIADKCTGSSATCPTDAV